MFAQWQHRQKTKNFPKHMRESRFIAQNRQKWMELEELLREKDYDADRLCELFVQVSDDLSYARTFYPNRSIRIYLNGLTQEVFGLLRRFRRNQARKLLTFWTHSLPVAYWEGRRELSLSMFVFGLACIIGVVSQVYDPEFCRSILGDGYVDTTLDNIAKGEPTAIYQGDDSFNMFARITVNNIQVALWTFIVGIFAGIGSLFSLMSNGVMLGCFQYFFFAQGVGIESMLAIWIHGTIEIASIVVAGGAGLVLGRGILFPGTLSRLQAFRLCAIQGLKMFLGTVPLFVIAGFAESYLTRHTDVHDWVRGMFILLCVFFCLGYYIFLPWRRRGLATSNERNTRLPADKPITIDYHSIKDASSLYLDGFSLMVKFSGVIFRSATKILAAILMIGGLTFWLLPAVFSEWLQPDLNFTIDEYGNTDGAAIFWPKIIAFALILVGSIGNLWRSIATDADDSMPEKTPAATAVDFFLLIPFTFVIALWWSNFDDNILTIFQLKGLKMWWVSLFAPGIFLVFYDSFIQRMFFLRSVSGIWPLWTGKFWAGALMCFLAYLAAFLMTWGVNVVLSQFIFPFVSLNLSLTPEGLIVVNQTLLFVADAFLLVTWSAILSAAFASWYYNRIEANDARGLMARIDEIGLTPRIQGLRRE